jgi:hypothetical protein
MSVFDNIGMGDGDFSLALGIDNVREGQRGAKVAVNSGMTIRSGFW